jgi:hypothetical protein
VRLLVERDDLNAPLLSSKTDAQRDTELARVNGKLYTIAKVQSDKSCPAVANVPPSSVVRRLCRSVIFTLVQVALAAVSGTS